MSTSTAITVASEGTIHNTKHMKQCTRSYKPPLFSDLTMRLKLQSERPTLPTLSSMIKEKKSFQDEYSQTIKTIEEQKDLTDSEKLETLLKCVRDKGAQYDPNSLLLSSPRDKMMHTSTHWYTKGYPKLRSEQDIIESALNGYLKDFLEMKEEIKKFGQEINHTKHQAMWAKSSDNSKCHGDVTKRKTKQLRPVVVRIRDNEDLAYHYHVMENVRGRMIRAVIVSISGTVGAGKSTIIQKIMDMYEENIMECQKHVKIYEMKENITHWRDDNGFDWLSENYNDMKRWSFAFQTKVLQSQCDQFENITHSLFYDGCEEDDYKTRIILVERSPLDGRYIFANTLFQDQNLKKSELNLFGWLWEKTAWTPDYVVSIQLDLEECLQRIRKRDNGYETDEAYFTRLWKSYVAFSEHDYTACQDENPHRLSAFMPKECIQTLANHENHLEECCDTLMRNLLNICKIIKTCSNVSLRSLST